jgi:hypothetical protein
MISSSQVEIFPSALRLAPSRAPPVIRPDDRLFQPRAPQPSLNLVARVAEFYWRGQAVELIVDANAKRVFGVLLHRYAFGNPVQPRREEQLIRPDEARERNRRGGERQAVKQPVWNARGASAGQCAQREQCAFDRLILRLPIEVDVNPPSRFYVSQQIAERSPPVFVVKLKGSKIALRAITRSSPIDFLSSIFDPRSSILYLDPLSSITEPLSTPDYFPARARRSSRL